MPAAVLSEATAVCGLGVPVLFAAAVLFWEAALYEGAVALFWATVLCAGAAFAAPVAALLWEAALCAAAVAVPEQAAPIPVLLPAFRELFLLQSAVARFACFRGLFEAAYRTQAYGSPPGSGVPFGLI